MTSTFNKRKCLLFGLEQLGDEFLRSIPDVWQIVNPLALEIECEPGHENPSTFSPVLAPSFCESRYYTIRAKCKKQTRAHVYLVGLGTLTTDGDMTSIGAERIASLLNDQDIVMSLYDYKQKCDSPFSHGSIADHVQDDFFFTLEGIAFHCHCDTPFSSKCWKSAYCAADKIGLLCKDLRRAKSSMKTATL